MVTIGLVVVIAASLLVVFAGAAVACSCLDQSEAELYEGADVVFVAAVVAATPGDLYVFEMSVESVQKGEVPAEATVMVNRSDVEDCLFEMAVSDTYQVFAGATDGAYTTGLCAGTHSLEAAPAFAPDGTHSPAPADDGDTVAPAADEVPADGADPETTDDRSTDSQTSPPDGATAAPDAARANGDAAGVPIWVLLVAVAAALGAGYVLASSRLRGRGGSG